MCQLLEIVALSITILKFNEIFEYPMIIKFVTGVIEYATNGI